MTIGNFYFLHEDYFKDFPDSNLMRNIEMIDGKPHDRPCFFAFQESANNIYWMIPFSSQIGKFKSEYERKIRKTGICDTIMFGEVLGHQKAFLIQNMCPILQKYVKNEYIDKDTCSPVQISKEFKNKLIKSAKKVLALVRNNKTDYVYVWPNILKIEKILTEQVKKTED